MIGARVFIRGTEGYGMVSKLELQNQCTHVNTPMLCHLSGCIVLPNDRWKLTAGDEKF